MTKKQIKMTFEAITDFETLIDEETFIKEYKGNLLKLCKFMCKAEGIHGWFDEEIKLVKADFVK